VLAVHHHSAVLNMLKLRLLLLPLLPQLQLSCKHLQLHLLLLLSSCAHRMPATRTPGHWHRLRLVSPASWPTASIQQTLSNALTHSSTYIAAIPTHAL
jgi:hypothetical protein